MPGSLSDPVERIEQNYSTDPHTQALASLITVVGEAPFKGEFTVGQMKREVEGLREKKHFDDPMVAVWQEICDLGGARSQAEENKVVGQWLRTHAKGVAHGSYTLVDGGLRNKARRYKLQEA